MLGWAVPAVVAVVLFGYLSREETMSAITVFKIYLLGIYLLKIYISRYCYPTLNIHNNYISRSKSRVSRARRNTKTSPRLFSMGKDPSLV
jgi:predicted membrane channel-forming protein YqfA (hemolysin III family)